MTRPVPWVAPGALSSSLTIDDLVGPGPEMFSILWRRSGRVNIFLRFFPFEELYISSTQKLIRGENTKPPEEQRYGLEMQ